jgi:arginine-tRNA-protein transferase
MRISPTQFKPSKKQRHIFRKNTDVKIHLNPPSYTDEKFEVYRRYIEYQHPGSPQGTSEENFKRAFYAVMPSSAEIEYRIGNELAGLTFVDIIPGEALSSIYHFFNPDFASRSIGVFSVLIEIMLCPEFHVPWYYIGYWVPGCKKMEYKAQYKPYQLLINGEWMDGVEDFSRG